MTEELITGKPVDRLHGIQVGGRIKKAIARNGLKIKDAAKVLRTTPGHLAGIIGGYVCLAAKDAAYMHQVDLDGMQLYLGQAAHRYWCACQHYPNTDPRFMPKENEDD